MSPVARFRDRTVLITGAGSGIGRATAHRLASEGAAVFLVGKTGSKLEAVAGEVKKAGGKAGFETADLRKPEDCRRAVEAGARWNGRLDAVVNGAGTFPSAPFPDLTDEDWQQAIESNLAAPMRVTRAAVPHLKKGGAVVNISSINAVIGDKLSACSHYSAAKAGLLGLTRQLAVELAPEIRVNAIVPGAVKTPMLDGWNEDPADMKAWLERFVPLNRIARPEEMAGVIAFLASDDASYLTGATIVADGGVAIV
ncbi:MAG: SDR family NAD(P)-dependent oxidoreductase [Hyphomicrobium sp.]|jgi:NAD(P)-dependent dehydrogenase (short-subunit alcohol dehydrogenase family)|uniref:SDR family NAD(P)-dependent oxidoreductase n=1 Tax=Hyphomicrobium sp. TaxID=82 RepID=UPI003D0A5B30